MVQFLEVFELSLDEPGDTSGQDYRQQDGDLGAGLHLNKALFWCVIFG